MGSKEIGPDSYLGPTRYRITCKCNRCGHVYRRVFKAVPKDNPPCPKKACKAAVAQEERSKIEANIRRMIEEERGPMHIGNKPVVKAIDKTAEIVMTDHGLTNLKDNIREGESMAPPLAPRLQQAADNFFSGPKLNEEQTSRRAKQRAAQISLLGQRAIRGAFRDMSINPGNLTQGATPGQTALRKVGEEKIRNS